MDLPRHPWPPRYALATALLVAGCGDGTAAPNGSSGGTGADNGNAGAGAGNGSGGTSAGNGNGGSGGGTLPPKPDLTSEWPTANEYSWNGVWTPSFPLEGMFDNEYFDGHDGSPILPPGHWDYEDANNDLADWRNFKTNVGDLKQLLDSQNRIYGWELLAVNPAGVDVDAKITFFEGSAGADWFDFGPDGVLHSTWGEFGAGPDVLVFNRSYSLDFRIGGAVNGAGSDDDLVIAGCDVNGDASFDILTTTVHTGPGADWAFIRDFSRAAIDLGNGGGGRTDSIDTTDGNDLAVIRGNSHDFRIFGGFGHDTAVWYVDENIQTETWLGPAFFGGGGEGDAIWGDPGTDRLVMAIAEDAPIVDRTPTPNGSFLVRGTSGELVLDGPTQYDEYAAYCSECGESPDGRRTIIFEYNSPDGAISTGYFYVTAFEELQIGIGEGARVYRIDDKAGTVELADDLKAYVPPSPPASFCE